MVYALAGTEELIIKISSDISSKEENKETKMDNHVEVVDLGNFVFEAFFFYSSVRKSLSFISSTHFCADSVVSKFTNANLRLWLSFMTHDDVIVPYFPKTSLTLSSSQS
jgi:hypothetical protein